MSHRDIFGNELKVGDVVAYAATYIDSCALRIARVDELKTSKPRWVGDDRLVPTLLLTALGSHARGNGFHHMEKRVNIRGTGSSENGYTFSTVVRLSGVDFDKLFDGASKTRW